MFPLEIWVLVAEEADAPTILSLRAASNGLHYICNQRFEELWISERVHHSTPMGFTKLRRDTEHPKFASLISTVIVHL